MKKIFLFCTFLTLICQPFLSNAQPITFDFECGCLTGWKLSSKAFALQPTLNDNPTARNRKQPSQHEGAYWIGGYQNYTSYNGEPGSIAGDGLTGTMQSSLFTIYSDRISFLIGGGCRQGIALQLWVDGQVVKTARGDCRESMVRKSWNVVNYKGKKGFLRAVDNATGSWGHLNFDDIKFTYL